MTTEIKTAEQIAQETDHKTGRANIAAINALYRAQDASELWPIRNRFNATERAIRRARDFTRQTCAVYGLEYCYLLESILTEIVNKAI